MNNNKIVKLNNYEIANIFGGNANDILLAQPKKNLNATQILNEFCNSTCGCERECSAQKTEAYDQGYKSGAYYECKDTVFIHTMIMTSISVFAIGVVIGIRIGVTINNKQ